MKKEEDIGCKKQDTQLREKMKGLPKMMKKGVPQVTTVHHGPDWHSVTQRPVCHHLFDLKMAG